MSAPRFIFPVYGFAADGLFKVESVADFFDYGSAADFAMHGDRNLYVGEARYDRRTSGYRFTPEPVGQTYQEWLAEVDARRVAA